MVSTAILDIGSRRELFVDYYLIDSMEDVELKLHEPRNEGVALQLDQPWESPYACYFTVFKESLLIFGQFSVWVEAIHFFGFVFFATFAFRFC